ncbi:NAD-dependent epimerase/dehydratase family protein [Saccharibacter sp. 17.LH.SD]|nr:NAD-dependent epimerase/dehydratase family protein [Saccharibacter sp. 17.LH.SD]
MSLAEGLLKSGAKIVGVDTCQNHPLLAEARLERLRRYPGFVFLPIDVTDQSALVEAFKVYPDIKTIVHLAARGGVRRSREQPHLYVEDNIRAQVSLLEAARCLEHVEHILYASSSAVYGRSLLRPFKESDPLGPPSSFYAVTKRTNELTAQTYSHLYGFPQSGMRFFTVYGPWGRPDMACYGFAQAIRDEEPITLWAGENLARDFTYISDVVSAIRSLIKHPPQKKEARVFNIGRGCPEKVSVLVQLLEENLGQKAIITRPPRPREDLETTWASTDAMKALVQWKASIELKEGIRLFSQWFQQSSPL